VWFARFEDSIANQEIEVATNTSRGQSETLSQYDSSRWAVLEDRAGHSITGAHIIDFHNSIVS
jgi:hypothetical protein